MHAGSRPGSYTVRTQSAFVDFFRRGVELGNIERATRDAELASDAVLLLEIDDPVRILHDGAVGRTRAQASGIGAVHALMLAHQPCEAAVGMLALVELDQVPVVPVRVRHGLVGVVEHGVLERHVVPFHACYFARFAPNTGGGVDQLADVRLALRAFAGNRSRMGRDLLNLQRLAVAHLAPPMLSRASPGSP